MEAIEAAEALELLSDLHADRESKGASNVVYSWFAAAVHTEVELSALLEAAEDRSRTDGVPALRPADLHIGRQASQVLTRRHMGSKRPETMAKRARELAVKEKRERKRERKAEAAAQKLEQAAPDAEPEGETAD